MVAKRPATKRTMAYRVAQRYRMAPEKGDGDPKPTKREGARAYRGDDFTVTSEITQQERIDPFRDAAKKAARYGGKASDWRKMKGRANVRYDNGEVKSGAEIHWVEAHGIGRFEFKVKKR